MIEVFKTNVSDHDSAARILSLIKEDYPEYLANFDLHDCDHVLRIQTTTERVHAHAIISLLRIAGFNASILEDIVVV